MQPLHLESKAGCHLGLEGAVTKKGEVRRAFACIPDEKDTVVAVSPGGGPQSPGPA